MPDRKRESPVDERVARMDLLLEELRLNTEDLRALAKQANERAMAHDKLKVVRGPRKKRGKR